MFRRKKPAIDKQLTPSLDGDSDLGPDGSGTAHRPPYRAGSPAVGKPPFPQPSRPDGAARRVLDIPSPRRPIGGTDGEGKKLIVGRDITLSGNISACDRLVVEGTVEASVANAVVLEIPEAGLFRGAAEVDEAEISGRFEGELTVRKKLTVRPTGRIEGRLRYARLVVESGGQIVGSVEAAAGGAPVAQLGPPSPGGEEAK